MRNRSIAFCFFLCISAGWQPLKAQSIYFNFKNGTSSSFALSNVRTITFTDTIMNLNLWNGTIHSWNMKTVSNYNYTGIFTSASQTPSEKMDVLIFPNPGRSPISIQYDLQVPGEILIEVTDLSGRRVTSFSEKKEKAGTYTLTWDATSGTGTELKAGIYFCNFTSSNQHITKKLILTY